MWKVVETIKKPWSFIQDKIDSVGPEEMQTLLEAPPKDHQYRVVQFEVGKEFVVEVVKYEIE